MQINPNCEGLRGEYEEYSLTEKKIGKWVDGSDLYIKTVDIGVLPNNTLKSVNHGISNFKHAVDIRVVAYRSNGISAVLPYASTGYCSVTANTTSVDISTNLNMSSYTYSYATLKYVKTS